MVRLVTSVWWRCKVAGMCAPWRPGRCWVVDVILEVNHLVILAKEAIFEVRLSDFVRRHKQKSRRCKRTIGKLRCYGSCPWWTMTATQTFDRSCFCLLCSDIWCLDALSKYARYCWWSNSCNSCANGKNKSAHHQCLQSLWQLYYRVGGGLFNQTSWWVFSRGMNIYIYNYIYIYIIYTVYLLVHTYKYT